MILFKIKSAHTFIFSHEIKLSMTSLHENIHIGILCGHKFKIIIQKKNKVIYWEKSGFLKLFGKIIASINMDADLIIVTTIKQKRHNSLKLPTVY